MGQTIGLAQIGELGARSLASSAEAIAAVADLVQRATGVSFTVVSEITTDGKYVFQGVESGGLPIRQGAAIPYEWSLCSRIHHGESPPTVSDTRDVPALWANWLRLKERMGVDWDILAFCTRDVRLPDGSRFGTLCVHHLETRTFSEDEEALLEVLGLLLGQEVWRERAATELADAIGALEVAEKRRAELAEELRHELRAPLQVIDGYAEAMLDAVVARDDEHVTLVRDEAGRAMRLLDDLVDLARLEVRVADDEPAAPLRVDEVVLEMRERLLPLAEAAGVELAADVEPALVRIARKRLEQLVVNVVRNALRAVEAGGGTRIVVFARRDRGAVSVGCDDDGPGIAEEELPRIFDRFFRGNSGRSGPSGSGLGLTIVRRIVESAHGSIEAEPLAPRGIRIVARLPAEKAVAGDAHATVEP